MVCQTRIASNSILDRQVLVRFSIEFRHSLSGTLEQTYAYQLFRTRRNRVLAYDLLGKHVTAKDFEKSVVCSRLFYQHVKAE